MALQFDLLPASTESTSIRACDTALLTSILVGRVAIDSRVTVLTTACIGTDNGRDGNHRREDRHRVFFVRCCGYCTLQARRFRHHEYLPVGRRGWEKHYCAD